MYSQHTLDPMKHRSNGPCSFLVLQVRVPSTWQREIQNLKPRPDFILIAAAILQLCHTVLYCIKQIKICKNKIKLPLKLKNIFFIQNLCKNTSKHVLFSCSMQTDISRKMSEESTFSFHSLCLIFFYKHHYFSHILLFAITLH